MKSGYITIKLSLGVHDDTTEEELNEIGNKLVQYLDEVTEEVVDMYFEQDGVDIDSSVDD